jgi:peptide/nickel transport system ATP-binding protein
VLAEHRNMGRKEAVAEGTDLLDRVGIPDPARRMNEYPHQLSGGMRQRALIAMALACSPRLLIADEPTTALDVTIQAQILELLRELVQGSGTALVMITHDLGVVAGLCDRVHVMYAGKIIETADRHDLFARPRQPYTGGLLASVPRLDAGRGTPLTPIRGSARDAIPWAEGCAFAPRCDNAEDDCLTEVSGSTIPLEYDGPGRELRCRHPLQYPPAAAGATALGAGR